MSRFFKKLWSGKKQSYQELPSELNPSLKRSSPPSCQGGYQTVPEDHDDESESELTMTDFIRLNQEANDLKISRPDVDIDTIDEAIEKYSQSYSNGDGYKLAGLSWGNALIMKARALKPKQFELFYTQKDVVKQNILDAVALFRQGIKVLKHAINSIYSDNGPDYNKYDVIGFAYNDLNLYYENGLVWKYDLDLRSEGQASALDILFDTKAFEELVPEQNRSILSLTLVNPSIERVIEYYMSELVSHPRDKNILFSIAKCYMLLFKKSNKYSHLEQSKMYLDELSLILQGQSNDDIINLREEVSKYLDDKTKRLEGHSCAGGGGESAGGGELMRPPPPFDGGGKSRTHRNKSRARRNKSRARRNKSRKIKKRIRTKK